MFYFMFTRKRRLQVNGNSVVWNLFLQLSLVHNLNFKVYLVSCYDDVFSDEQMLGLVVVLMSIRFYCNET